MGFALAEACAKRGAEVKLVAGPVSLKTFHPHIHRINIESAEEMYNMVIPLFPEADVAILCAAVADYRPLEQKNTKIKRENNELFSLPLIRNKDIASALGKRKRANQLVAGFALETNEGMINANKKLVNKNLDMIIMNSLEDTGAGFQYDTNKVTIIDRKGEIRELPLKSKKEIATDIVDKLITLLQ
jgi:phosphopantothenoylcysteine decarboxylase/phosphopantothenate--cysteine ligase